MRCDDDYDIQFYKKREEMLEDLVKELKELFLMYDRKGNPIGPHDEKTRAMAWKAVREAGNPFSNFVNCW